MSKLILNIRLENNHIWYSVLMKGDTKQGPNELTRCYLSQHAWMNCEHSSSPALGLSRKVVKEAEIIISSAKRYHSPGEDSFLQAF